MNNDWLKSFDKEDEVIYKKIDFEKRLGRKYISEGPWCDEPDKIEWKDKKTGYDCLIRRSDIAGALCGYVGLPKDHFLYGKYVGGGDCCDVHGGITFEGAFCNEEDKDGICHNSKEKVWWIGFDCAHGWDFLPFMELPYDEIDNFSYKDISYVKNEIEKLASFLYDKK